MDYPYPAAVDLDWPHQYRIIPSRYPPINFFENLVDPGLMDEVFEIEAMTNDRLRVEAGDISLVPPEDRISGPCSSVVMAAFTHISPDVESRFSNGTFGVYYAANSLETAIAETRYHRARFMRYTREAPCELDMRVYVGDVLKPMHDVRASAYDVCHKPDDWSPSQALGKQLKQDKSWGLVFRSVRNPRGECVAALRPPAISIPIQGSHLSYLWDGNTISRVFEKKLIAE